MEVSAGTGKPILLASSVVISYLYGEWSVLLNALLIFIIIDYVTGVLAAGYHGRIKAETMFWGIAKKGVIFAVTILAHQADLLYKEVTGTQLGVGEFQISALAIAVVYYILNEAISVTENTAELGVKFPPIILKTFQMFNHKGEGDKHD